MEYIAGNFSDVGSRWCGTRGCEAALACARLGMKTTFSSINLTLSQNMPCAT